MRVKVDGTTPKKINKLTLVGGHHARFWNIPRTPLHFKILCIALVLKNYLQVKLDHFPSDQGDFFLRRLQGWPLLVTVASGVIALLTTSRGPTCSISSISISLTSTDNFDLLLKFPRNE